MFWVFFSGTNRLVMYGTSNGNSDSSSNSSSNSNNNDDMTMTVLLAAALSAAMLVLLAAAVLIFRAVRRAKGGRNAVRGPNGPNGYTLASTGNRQKMVVF